MASKANGAQNHYLITDQPQFSRNRFKIAIVGTNGCGKTAFARRLARDMFCEEGTADSTEPFRQVFHKQMPDGSCAKVELIDVGMQQLNEHCRTANIIRQRLVVEGTPTTSVIFYAFEKERDFSAPPFWRHCLIVECFGASLAGPM